MDMGVSGDPAQTNSIAAHGPHGNDGGRTAGGRTANHFDLLQCRAIWGAWGTMAPMGSTVPSRRPVPSGGSWQANGKQITLSSNVKGTNVMHLTDAT